MKKVDLKTLIAGIAEPYGNVEVAGVNDHVVRLSVMTEPFYWHLHPNSDEMFLVVNGVVELETDEGAVQLGEGQTAIVKAGVAHCTRPLTPRSVNVTFERHDMQTERLDR